MNLGKIVSAQGPNEAADGNGVSQHHQEPSGNLSAGRFRRDRIDAGSIFQKFMIAVTLLAYPRRMEAAPYCGSVVRFITNAVEVMKMHGTGPEATSMEKFAGLFAGL